MTAFSDETGRELPSVTDLLLEAARHADNLGKSEWAKSAREAVRRAALSASPVAQEPVAIKPLEWTSEPPYWVARVFGGFYSIERHEHGTELQGTFIRHLRCASVEAAKSAAQFDYEKRIRGALTIPPATPAGLGADEIAQIIATKCFDPRVIDSSGKPFWKKSQWREAQQAANAILALLSRAGDQSNSTQKDGSR